MAVIDRPLRISQINVAEIRAVMAGPSPRVMAKMVFVDDMGQFFGQTVVHSFSSDTLDLLRQLMVQMERDAIDIMAADDAPQSSVDEDPEAQGPWGQ